MKPTNWEFFQNLATVFQKKSSRANYLDCCRDLGKIWPNLQIRMFLKCNVLKCSFTFSITKNWWIYSARLGSLCYMYDLRQILKDFYGVTRAKQGLVSLRQLAPQCQILEFLACKWAFRCCSFIMSQQISSFPKFIFLWHHYFRTLYKQYCHLQLHVCPYLDGYSLPLHMI